MSVEATFHKNALIKNLVILFDFFCAVESIYSFFQTDRFFWFNLIVFVGRYWKQLPYTLPIWILFISYTILGYLNSRFKWLDLDFWLLTFRDHLGSKLFPKFEIPYITSYLTSIDTFSLSRTVLEIFDFKVLKVWPWPLIFTGKPRSKICSSFEIPYMTSYLTSIDTCSLSRTVFEIFDFKVFRVWPWPSTFGVTLGQKKKFHHSKAHIWLPI